jgi:hypothetical protein
MLECSYAVSFMSTVADVERHSAECLHAECHYYECHYGVSWRLCLTNKKSMAFPIASKLKKMQKLLSNFPLIDTALRLFITFSVIKSLG